MSVNLISITKYKNDSIPYTYFVVFMTLQGGYILPYLHGFIFSHWFDANKQNCVVESVVFCKYMTVNSFFMA